MRIGRCALAVLVAGIWGAACGVGWGADGATVPSAAPVGGARGDERAVPAVTTTRVAGEDVKGLSLHVKGQTLTQVADALQRQVGRERQISAMGLPGAVYTVDKDNQSLSELAAALDGQSPVCLAVSSRKAAVGDGKGGDGEADVFFVRVELRDNRNLFSLPQLVMLVDVPRRGIIQRSYASEITKAIDQDGKAVPLTTMPNILPPLPGRPRSTLPNVQPSGPRFSNIIRPVFQDIVLVAVDGNLDVRQVTALKALEGTLEFGLLEKGAIHTVDLQKPAAPLKTSQGTFTVSQEAGTITVSFEPPAPLTADTRVVVTRDDFLAGRLPAEPLSSISVRFYDKEHKLLVEGASGVMGGLLTASRVRPPAGVGRRRGDPIVPLELYVPAAATVEIALPEEMRPVSMPFRLHDVPVVSTVTPRSPGQP
jgi:hypothetical protein